MLLETARRFVGTSIDVDHLYDALTARGWTFDTEESDLFQMLGRTFWDEGVKVLVILASSCCVPPHHEVAVLEAIRVYRFDRDAFPRRNMAEALGLHDRNPEERDADHDELLRHGDPATRSFDALVEIDAADEGTVHVAVLAAVAADLAPALRTAPPPA